MKWDYRQPDMATPKLPESGPHPGFRYAQTRPSPNFGRGTDRSFSDGQGEGIPAGSHTPYMMAGDNLT